MSRAAMQQALEALERYEYAEARAALRAVIAEPEQEPVAWIDINDSGQILNEPRLWSEGNRDEVALYTAPTPRKPLTDEQIALISVECAATHKHDDFDFARAVERAHGIGEQHE